MIGTDLRPFARLAVLVTLAASACSSSSSPRTADAAPPAGADAGSTFIPTFQQLPPSPSGPQCVSGEDGWGLCNAGEACAIGEPFAGVCPLGSGTGCRPDPCRGRAFSCDCAAALCGPYHLCVEANEGKVTCAPNTSLEGVPERVTDSLPGSFVIAGDELCSSSRCVSIASGAVRELPGGQGWIELSEHAGYLYGFDGQRLTRVDLQGTSPVEVVSDRAPGSYAFDGDTIYFTERALDTEGHGDVVAAALDGSDPRTLYPAQVEIGGLRVYDETLYWAADGAVMRVALPDGTPERVELPWNALLFGVWVGDALYSLDDRQLAIHRLDLRTGELAEFPESGATKLASDGQDLYVALRAGELVRIVRVALRDGAPSDEVELAISSGVGDALLLDAEHVYWASCDGIVRASR